MAASGQGVESAAEDHDRSVQDDQATDQEGVTQTRDHVIRMIQGLEACEGTDKTCQTRRKGISRMSFMIRPGIDGVNAAFPTRCCLFAQYARNAGSLLSRGRDRVNSFEWIGWALAVSSVWADQLGHRSGTLLNVRSQHPRQGIGRDDNRRLGLWYNGRSSSLDATVEDRIGDRASGDHRPGLRRPAAGPSVRERGIAVLGFDVDPVKVARLEAGQSYIGHISDATIRQMREQRFEATTSTSSGSMSPMSIIICVPTPLTDAREPDLTYIVNSTKAIAERLRPGQLVVLESTTYPGTTRDVVLPLLAGPRAQARDRLLPGLQPRARGPGQSAVLGPDHSQGRGGPRAGQPASSPSPFTARSSSGSCPSPARRSPRPARSSRTPTAPSISPWSMN